MKKETNSFQVDANTQNQSGNFVKEIENLKNILDKKEKYEKLPQDLKKIQNYILERV